MPIYTTTGSHYYTTATTTTSSSTALTYPSDGWYDGGLVPPRTVVREVVKTEGVISQPTGHLEIYLKDGTHICIDKDQNLRVRDDASKIIYKSNRVREFNRYVNASDLLEAFIADMGKMGARQGDILDTPIEVFINWIIFKAAEQDGDMAQRPRLSPQPRCKHCGKFISRKVDFEYCNPEHAARFFAKLQSIAMPLLICDTKN